MKSEGKKVTGQSYQHISVKEKRECDGREIEIVSKEAHCAKIVEPNEQNLIDLWEEIQFYMEFQAYAWNFRHRMQVGRTNILKFTENVPVV